jgi:hypothetical protein
MSVSGTEVHRRLNVRGLLIAVGLPILLVGSLVATLLGTGAFSRSGQSEDASLWLWTTPTGEIARVNGLTAATDARFEVTDAAGNTVQIEQTDRHLLLREIASGNVSAIDLTTLAITGTAETTPGDGVRVALHEDGAFIVDRLQGKVIQVDPVDLSPVGDPLSFPAGLTGGVFDRGGNLWLGVPREGTLVEIRPGETGARTVESRAIAEPRQQLSLTVLGDGVAVLNSTAQKMTTLRSNGALHETAVELLGPTQTAESSPGTVAAVTVTDPPSILTVDDATARMFMIAADSSPLLGAAMEFHERVYVPDGTSGLVWVYALDGTELDQIAIDSGKGPIELYHAGEVLFANAANTNSAVVVAADGTARQAEKDRDDILGGNVPPLDELSNAAGNDGDDERWNTDDSGNDRSSEGNGEQGGDEQRDTLPEPTPPGRVADLTAVGGDREVTLSWDAAPNNGAALTKYVVEGADRSWDIAPSQRVFEIGELTNGQAYEFTVTAHNALGSGPPAMSMPVVPTAEVPDAPSEVVAEAHPDGSVSLVWDEPDGQGNTITGYQVESVSSDGSSQVVAEPTETSHTFESGELDYGTGYTFTVRAVAGTTVSASSPQSNSVTPYARPDAPTNLRVTTKRDERGAVSVSWNQPANNGRTIQKYVVTANGRNQDVTGTSVVLSGYGDGQNVNVSVVAVNEAGESEPATGSASTVAPPSISLANVNHDGDRLEVTTNYDGGGGSATCEFSASYRRDGQPVRAFSLEHRGQSCSSWSVALDDYDSGDCTVTVTIKNVAGTDSATRTIRLR